MSILSVENVSHDFGGRTILENASFRLLNGEHIGLVGANGEGKSTFLNIITGKIAPDSGKIEWCKRISTGYLDQHTALHPGKTIYETLQDAFIICIIRTRPVTITNISNLFSRSHIRRTK